ncbi:major facilitator superfamily domain-containing protein [Mycena crocata]|nr:major facilitator superfamily domain-containing protein [Mycena crocata]
MTLKDQLHDIKRYRNAYFLALSAAMGSVFFGYDIGIIGGVIALPAFKEYFGINAMSASARAALSGNIVAILQGGALCLRRAGGGVLSNRWGRKPCMIAAGLIYIIGSVIQAVVGLGTDKAAALSVLYFGRFFAGRRHDWVNYGWVNYGASKNMAPTDMQWRMPFAVQVVPGVLFVLLIPFQPESPRVLVEHGQDERAARSLAFVARTSPDDNAVLNTIEEIKADFAGKPLFDSRAIFLRSTNPALMMHFQQWTGTNAINYFSPQIFASLGISGTTAGLFATGMPPSARQGAMMLWLGGGGYTGIHPSSNIVPASYVSIIAVYLYAVFYCIGWGPLPWVVAGKVAPNHLRTGAMSIAVAVQWLFSFTISKLTPIMLNDNKYATFLLFGFCCLGMAVWAWLCLPETTGYALEDIGLLFEQDVILRSVQDAPGGHFFLRKRRAAPIEELRAKADGEKREG